MPGFAGGAGVDPHGQPAGLIRQLRSNRTQGARSCCRVWISMLRTMRHGARLPLSWLRVPAWLISGRHRRLRTSVSCRAPEGCGSRIAQLPVLGAGPASASVARLTSCELASTAERPPAHLRPLRYPFGVPRDDLVAPLPQADPVGGVVWHLWAHRCSRAGDGGRVRFRFDSAAATGGHEGATGRCTVSHVRTEADSPGALGWSAQFGSIAACSVSSRSTRRWRRACS